MLDASSVERIRRFYHRADACREYIAYIPFARGARARRFFVQANSFLSLSQGCLIGRLLPRVLLNEQRGVSAEKIHLATTEAGKPYFARISYFCFSLFPILFLSSSNALRGLYCLGLITHDLCPLCERAGGEHRSSAYRI